MRNTINALQLFFAKVPGFIYLGIAVVIFGASNSVTRTIIDIGKNHLVDGRNPVSICNVLFVGNICAFLLMAIIFHRDWRVSKLKKLTRNDWISLTVIGILSGGIAPALIFAAFDYTTVTNIVLIGYIEPSLTLALSFWLLGSRVNLWTVMGSLISFTGAVVTAFLGDSRQMITMMGGLQLGKGEIFVAIAAIILSLSMVISKLRLQSIPLGIFSIYRTLIGTVIFFLLANVLYGPHHFSEVLSPFLWQWMLVYAAVIVVTGQLCWFAGLKKATLRETHLASLLNPIAAIFMAYLILGEIPSKAQYLGGFILLIGIIISFVGNSYQTRIDRKSPRIISTDVMGNTTGFRGF